VRRAGVGADVAQRPIATTAARRIVGSEERVWCSKSVRRRERRIGETCENNKDCMVSFVDIIVGESDEERRNLVV
jgi:hypothetical protein